ncbi:MAG: hypothetical protein A3J80_01780 [Desulfobacula sp. RIFOXYB2_FULL_45_6]|nr:MAG: hypothetical protein A3J80_01780 [Desulfobacula sp. RIFOXYB2_FULL_45_6]
MAASKTGKKKGMKKTQAIHTYFAVRSQNELYYQMASVFKAVTKDKDELTQEMLGNLISMKYPDFFVENKL